MAHDPLDDIVSRQYDRWAYPQPIADLEEWLSDRWQWFDPLHAHRLMWPDRDYRPDMDILVAGCGTNQAAVIAYTNPSARVVAIDVSNASLDHHRWLKQKYDLANLELHQLPIEGVASLDRDFDLVITTGVLHHMADPAAGMRTLADLLRPDGVLAAMLYADYGRIGVHMMQTVFKDMGLKQDEEAVLLVRDALEQLGPHHPLATYLRIAPDLGHDAGLVDTFLHGRERAYTIDECRDLVASAGLIFQDVFLKASYYAPRHTTSNFLRSVAALPRERQWSIMQRVNASNACHYFLACRPERPRQSYAIDFTSGDPRGYVPSFRKGVRLEGSVLHGPDGHVRLDPVQASLAERIDGHRTIAEITAAGETPTAALEFFRSLWQRDFLAMGIVTP